MKIWLRTIVGEKAIKSYVLSPEHYSDNDIEEYINTICNEIDEPTPVLLNKHFVHLRNFNNTTFVPSDFVENVYFEKMRVEIFDENDKKNKNKPIN